MTDNTMNTAKDLGKVIGAVATTATPTIFSVPLTTVQLWVNIFAGALAALYTLAKLLQLLLVRNTSPAQHDEDNNHV